MESAAPPSPLQPPIDTIGREARFKFEFGWVVQIEAAMKLVPAVSPESGIVGEITVACPLALGPISHVVQPDHADRTGHPDEHAKIDAQVFKPEWTLEAVVDKSPMHSHGVSGT